jgi:hypothetical protein
MPLLLLLIVFLHEVLSFVGGLLQPRNHYVLLPRCVLHLLLPSQALLILKMECKETNKFILQNGMKITRLPHLSKTVPSTHQRWVDVFHHLRSLATDSTTTLKKGVHRPHPTLSFEELLRDALQLFDILFKTNTSEYSSKT